jgi:predicted unusual protein kinase regulating ubiquinone biosynthesis (AarF/ABC1/UbiB family)/DNA-binding XRE family transcriptional regulator
MPRRREGDIRSEEARRLRRIRDALELTQREMAEQFGVASSAIAQWESGKHTIPGPVLRLIELYESETGVAMAAPEEMPVSWSARTPRAAAAAVLWLVFFGTREQRNAQSLLGQVRSAALRRYSKLVGDLKGLAMKLEQMTAYADMVLPEEDRALLASLRTRAQPMSRAAVCQVFVEDFGKTPRQLFAEWSPEPFATASIGQVHEARLTDGRQVAVKVQYPRIVDALRVDLDQAAIVDRVLSVFLPSQGRRVMIDEMRTRILEECNYVLEASRQRAFAELFAGRADVRVPSIVGELSSRRVLTSELERGDTLESFAARSDAAARDRAGATLLDFYLGSAFKQEMYNTDPNPGNFLFGAERVTFLDFGRIKQFSPGFVAHMKAIVRALLEGDRARFRSFLVDMGAVPNPDQYDFDYTFRGMLLLHRPYLCDEPFTYRADHMQRVWRVFVQDNPNLSKTHFTADMAFLHQFHFGVTALLVRLGASVAYRARLLDLLYQPGEMRPPPFTGAQLALLDLA